MAIRPPFRHQIEPCLVTVPVSGAAYLPLVEAMRLSPDSSGCSLPPPYYAA